MNRFWRMLAMGLLTLLTLYAAFPFIAGALEIGNRWGPRIYPLTYHEALYMIGWDAAGREGKPRVAAGLPEESRPWFYGMQSTNAAVSNEASSD